jgi:hypothetical protein
MGKKGINLKRVKKAKNKDAFFKAADRIGDFLIIRSILNNPVFYLKLLLVFIIIYFMYRYIMSKK